MSTATNLTDTTGRPASPRRSAVSGRRSEAAVCRLVRRAAGGDERAWNDLVDEFGALVWSVARGSGLNDADAADVSQITWQLLVEHLDRLRDPARVGAWLATTARRQALRGHRSPPPMPVGDDLPDQVSDAPAPAAALLGEERDRALAAAVSELPQRDQLLLRMLMAEPAPSYNTIATAMDMPIGSIGPTRARALERLRVIATRHGLDAGDR